MNRWYVAHKEGSKAVHVVTDSAGEMTATNNATTARRAYTALTGADAYTVDGPTHDLYQEYDLVQKAFELAEWYDESVSDSDKPKPLADDDLRPF